MPRRRVCVATAGGPHPWIIINALGHRFGAIDVILEEPEPRWEFLKRRAKKTGWVSTAGQFATMLLVRSGKLVFARRIDRIVAEHGLDPEPHPEHPAVKVGSVNSTSFTETVERLSPAVVLLVGCRILQPGILDRIACPVLNYHAGITPQYRGMNGGYWALANGDRENFGATVHLVDPGIDTGGVIRQVHGAPAPDDNIMTYAYRLAALSRDMCAEAVADALERRLVAKVAEGSSRQWYHPPIWSYLWTGLSKGVW